METLGYITASIVVFVLTILFITWIARLIAGKKPETLAGTVIPELRQGFDISKLYDIVYSGGNLGSQFIERLERVKILGYIGQENEGSFKEMYMRSRWLVVTFADGRKGYLMPHSILSLQESAPETA
ncbi:MAG: hypothetical protein FJ271_20675 [Planctomycetes bacterium]|nr:hypothetical protein [Planctomycetota bacterium]